MPFYKNIIEEKIKTVKIRSIGQSQPEKSAKAIALTKKIEVKLGGSKEKNAS